MKKFSGKTKKIVAAVLACLMFAISSALVGCNNNNNATTTLAYVESASVDSNGNLIIKFSDGQTKNAGNVKGPNGTDGEQGATGVAGEKGDKGDKGDNGANGTNGANGVSVRETYVNANGELIVIFSDGTKHNAGITYSKNVTLNKVAGFATGFTNADGGVAEIVKYNKDNNKAYLVNGQTKTLDIVELKKYGSIDDEFESVFNENIDRIYFNKLVEEHSTDFEENFVVGDITSVSVNTELDIIAVALQHQDYSKNGAIALLDYSGAYIKAYPCGVQPDMLMFNGKTILTADEGEPRQGYESGAVDPKGSVTILDLSSGNTSGTATTVDFTSFDSKRAELAEKGVVIKKGANPSTDFEPEYITVSGDYAYVSLQEANSIATLNLTTKQFISVLPLGFKDHSVEGNGLDLLEDSKIEIKNQDVFGVRMPDGIDSFVYNGETYIATANEGDAREWPADTAAYSGVKKVKIGSTNVEALDNAKWDGLAADKIYVLGGRSFSIYKASDMSLVYDSGDTIEQTVAKVYPKYFNCSNDKVTMDGRSKKKGPEPETVLVREIDKKLYAFVCLERIGGVMTFDITHFAYGDVILKNYVNTRDFTANIKGDVGPEGMDFVYAEDNIFGKNLLAVANENSGTVAFYAVENEAKTYNLHATFTEKNPADHLVIYSAYGAGGKTDGAVSHNYIAIKNPTSSTIDLTNYKLAYKSGTATEYTELTLSGTIAAGKVKVVVGKNAAKDNSSTLKLTVSNESNANGFELDNKAFSIKLLSGTTVIDLLGVTETTSTNDCETATITGISKQKIVIRKGDYDRDNNSIDFIIVDFTSPTAAEISTKLGLSSNS